MTREDFFDELDQWKRPLDKGKASPEEKAKSIYRRAQKLKKKVNPGNITDDEIKKYLTKDDDIKKYLDDHGISIDDLIARPDP